MLSEWAGCGKVAPVYGKLFGFLFRDAFVVDYTNFRQKRYEIISDDEFKVTPE